VGTRSAAPCIELATSTFHRACLLSLMISTEARKIPQAGEVGMASVMMSGPAHGALRGGADRDVLEDKRPDRLAPRHQAGDRGRAKRGPSWTRSAPPHSVPPSRSFRAQPLHALSAPRR
jgi:hypothetical protein